jgi:hypothetical protein
MSADLKKVGWSKKETQRRSSDAAHIVFRGGMGRRRMFACDLNTA